MSGWWTVPGAVAVVGWAATDLAKLPAPVPTDGPNQVVVYVPLMT